MKTRLAFVVSVLTALALGILIGRASAPEIRPDPFDTVIDLEEIKRSMYRYQDSCVQNYQDGLRIAEEIHDPFLQKKHLQLTRHMTHLDVMMLKEVWIENCMAAKTIHNRVFGLDQ